MTFTIPSEADAAFVDQAKPDSRDFSDILGLAPSLTGVVTGCAVTAQGSPDMTVAVAVGIVLVNGLQVIVTAGNVTITAANGSNPRIDLICVDSSGTKSAVAGTAAANPVFPDPAGKTVLAAVYVPANDTDIDANQIVDKRILIVPEVASLVRAGSSYYYVGATRNLSAVAFGLNAMQSAPILLPAGITLDRIGIEITALAASSTVRLGIYYDSGGGWPGALLLDAGTVDSTTTGTKQITISQAISRSGVYWLACANQGGNPSVRSTIDTWTGVPLMTSFTATPATSHVGSGYSTTGISGALPDPFAANPGLGSNQRPHIFVRVA